jgi:hypothetical protein
MDKDVLKIEVFRTKDGKHFNNIQEAEAHAQEMRFDEKYAKSGHLYGKGQVVSPDNLRKWLLENKETVLEFLNQDV